MEERAPDPISAPQQYQDYLLGLLGQDDPAEVQASTPERLRTLVSAGADRLTVVPEPGEWSAYGCIAHMVDAELVMSGRYRWVLAHDQPPLIGYDQDLWVDSLHRGDESIDDLLALFIPLREANVALWQRTSVADRARVGIHAERGPESFELAFGMIAGHDRFHIDQAERALAAADS